LERDSPIGSGDVRPRVSSAVLRPVHPYGDRLTGPATLYYRDEEDLLASVDDPREHNDGVVYPLKVRINLKYLEDWSLARDIGYLVVTVLPALDRWLHLVPVVDEDEQLTTCAD
jgi:hypothetical protein